MPDDPEFDPAWLNSLGKQFDQLLQELIRINRERDEFLIKYKNPNEESEKRDDEYITARDTIIRNAAIKQLGAVLVFMDGYVHLMPELRKLFMALPDLGSGRMVKWLHPASRKGQPPPPIKDSVLHGYYAAIMDWLMKEGGKSRKESAKFIVTHGGIRRRLAASRKASATFTWKTVDNWYTRATRSDAPVPERAAFDYMYRLIRSRDLRREASTSIDDVAKSYWQKLVTG